MLHIKYKVLHSEFEYPFQTAYGVKTHQPALLVAITINGMTGYGEAPPVSYYNVTVDQMVEELLLKVKVLERYAFTEPSRFWHFCHHLFPTNPFLVCALDMAYWNVYAQIKKRSLRDLMNLPEDAKVLQEPLTDYTIGMDSIETMVFKLKAKPWPIYKIKLGSADDLGILEALRKETKAIFRVDANAGWTLDEALFLLPKLQALGVELVEQPLAKDDWEGMARLYKESVIPLIADESCVSEHDVEKCITCFHGINIKLTKCGGITPAIRMVLAAKASGKKIMMGCMSETEIGSLAIAQFLPWLDYVDMDGPLLLKDITLKKLRYVDGRVEGI